MLVDFTPYAADFVTSGSVLTCIINCFDCSAVPMMSVVRRVLVLHYRYQHLSHLVVLIFLVSFPMIPWNWLAKYFSIIIIIIFIITRL